MLFTRKKAQRFILFLTNVSVSVKQKLKYVALEKIYKKAKKVQKRPKRLKSTKKFDCAENQKSQKVVEDFISCAVVHFSDILNPFQMLFFQGQENQLQFTFTFHFDHF